MEKRDELYLSHVTEAVEKIIQFTTGRTWDDFRKDEMMQGAVIHQLMILGEAANKVSEDTQERMSELPWRDMVAMRNKLIHDYFHVRLEEIWRTVQEDIPNLKNILGI
ncbi:MAG: DUF86 domain-containing protein [bacterium]